MAPAVAPAEAAPAGETEGCQDRFTDLEDRVVRLELALEEVLDERDAAAEEAEGLAPDAQPGTVSRGPAQPGGMRGAAARCPGGVTTTGRCCTSGCACGGSCIACNRTCRH